MRVIVIAHLRREPQPHACRPLMPWADYRAPDAQSARQLLKFLDQKSAFARTEPGGCPQLPDASPANHMISNWEKTMTPLTVLRMARKVSRNPPLPAVWPRNLWLQSLDRECCRVRRPSKGSEDH